MRALTLRQGCSDMQSLLSRQPSGAHMQVDEAALVDDDRQQMPYNQCSACHLRKALLT